MSSQPQRSSAAHPRHVVHHGRRQAMELAICEEDLAALGAIARSRAEAASRVERARMLLAYWDDPSLVLETSLH